MSDGIDSLFYPSCRGGIQPVIRGLMQQYGKRSVRRYHNTVSFAYDAIGRKTTEDNVRFLSLFENEGSPVRIAGVKAGVRAGGGEMDRKRLCGGALDGATGGGV